MMPNAAHTPFSLLFSYPFSFSMMDVPGFFHSHTETITIFWRERNVCKDQQTAPDWGRAAVGRGRSAQASQGPPRVLLPPPLRPPSPGALPKGASSPGREAEPPHRKSESVYLITIQVLPTTTIRRPAPPPHPTPI